MMPLINKEKEEPTEESQEPAEKSGIIEVPKENRNEAYEGVFSCEGCDGKFTENVYVVFKKRSLGRAIFCISCDPDAFESVPVMGSPCLVGHISTETVKTSMAKAERSVALFLYLIAALCLAVYFILTALWKSLG